MKVLKIVLALICLIGFSYTAKSQNLSISSAGFDVSLTMAEPNIFSETIDNVGDICHATFFVRINSNVYTQVDELIISAHDHFPVYSGPLDVVWTGTNLPVGEYIQVIFEYPIDEVAKKLRINCIVNHDGQAAADGADVPIVGR